MTSQEQQFTFRETTDEFTHCLWVKPNGFWSEAVRVNIEKTTGGDWKVYMTTSSGGYEAGFDVFERTRNQASALLFATEWAETVSSELNKKVAS